MSLGEEDLGVLMKILVENIGEGSKKHNMDVKRQAAQGEFKPGDFMTASSFTFLTNVAKSTTIK